VIRVQSYVYCGSETSPPKNAIYSSIYLFIYLLIYQAQREHKTNIVEI